MASLRAKGRSMAAGPSRPPIDPGEAAAYIEGMAATWAVATAEERAQLVLSHVERITVRGSQVLRVRLTPMAEQAGLSALLPEDVPIEWAVARPTGVGRAITTYNMPVEGRDEWLAAVRRLA
jgi:hypothetical protein